MKFVSMIRAGDVLQLRQMRQRSSLRDELFSNQISHQPQHFARFGVTVQLRLGKQQFAVHRHLEFTAVRRHERDGLDDMLVILQQFLCQAHGSTCVVSDRAIHDFNRQHDSSNFSKIISLRQFGQKRPHNFIRRLCLDLLHRSHLPHCPIHDDSNTMAQFCRLVQVVRNEDRRFVIYPQNPG